ncbi:MAG: hypothetical protein ACR2K2_12025 [Mycobacteriales bacterium]
MAGVATALFLAGCSISSSKDQARDDATSQVRANAERIRGKLEDAARGTTGAAQLAAVRATLPDRPLVVSDSGVRVDVALTSRSESGGGLSYAQVIVRLCVSYSIAADSGETRLADADCPADVDATVRPDAETVTLAD